MLAKRKSQSGQAMVEFALTMPILILLIIGIINFGVVLFSYSHASNQLRDALRYSEIMGYYTDTGATKPYLDCDKISRVAKQGWFTTGQTAVIKYRKMDGSNKVFKCGVDSYSTLFTNVKNGDVLQIDLTADVNLLFLPIGPLHFDFKGERSIMFSVGVDPVTP